MINVLKRIQKKSELNTTGLTGMLNGINWHNMSKVVFISKLDKALRENKG